MRMCCTLRVDGRYPVILIQIDVAAKIDHQAFFGPTPSWDSARRNTEYLVGNRSIHRR